MGPGCGCNCKRMISEHMLGINSLRPRQNGRSFADDTFKRIFLNENVRISIKISLKFVPKGPINNNPALVQIMAWRRPGDKPLSESMLVRLPTHICVTRPQWVKKYPWAVLRHIRDLGFISLMVFPSQFKFDGHFVLSWPRYQQSERCKHLRCHVMCETLLRSNDR